ncbi:MAG: hypothetical protein JWM14_2749 [Chitinophagaceae bacterium]|nr:hypothetical protein [Chitinophagaceae bacterium]
MKKHFSLLVFSLLALSISLSSCKKSNDPDPSNDGGSATPKQQYEKKWVINNASANRIAASNDSTDIQSIELHQSTYIIILSNGTPITGSFTNTDDDQLNLNNYGTLVISELSANTFTFSVHLLNTDGSVDFSSTPAVSVTTTDREPNFYKTWKVTGHTSDLNAENSSWESIDEIRATFSEYGTYLVQTKYKAGQAPDSLKFYDGTYSYGINTWKWSDDSHQSLCYGPWDNTTNEVVCTDNNSLDIVFTNDEKTTMRWTQHLTVLDTTYTDTYNLELQ